MKQDWKDILKEGMANHEEQVPEGLWENIEQSLDERTAQRKPMGYRWMAYVAAAMIALATGSYWLLRETPATVIPEGTPVSSHTITQHHTQPETSAETFIPVEKPDLVAQARPAMSHQDSVEVLLDNTATTEIIEPDPEKPDKTETIQPVVIDEKDYTQPEQTEETKPENRQPSIATSLQNGSINNKRRSKTASSGHKLTASIYGNNAFGQAENRLWAIKAAVKPGEGLASAGEIHGQQTIKKDNNYYIGQSAAASIKDNTYGGYDAEIDTPHTSKDTKDPISELKEKVKYEKINAVPTYPGMMEHVRYDHHLPINVGVSLNYQLSERWGISSGLDYSLLASNLYKESSLYSKQKLHYIGVPLQMSFFLLGNNRWRIYVNASGEMQLNVSASMEQHLNGKEQQNSTISFGTEKDRIQWSVGAGAGIQFNLNRTIGIYAEPGFRHYFNNGSDVDTYYKLHPNTFNLQMGLRFNIR